MARQQATYVPVSPVTIGGRLTLVSNDPTPVTDQTAKTTLYFLPYKGQQIALYNGSSWVLRDIGSSGISLTVASFPSGGAASTLYDIFAYDSSGTVTLEALAWTTSTAGASARATALVYQDGILSKTGALTRRYLGTVYLNGSTQLEDSVSNRNVWNLRNQVQSYDATFDATSTWTTSNTSYHAFNGGAATFKHSFVVGYQDGRCVRGVCFAQASNSFGQGRGVGLSSTSALHAGSSAGVDSVSSGTFAEGELNTPVGTVGYNYLQGLEKAFGGTTTFYGGSQQSGFITQVWH